MDRSTLTQDRALTNLRAQQQAAAQAGDTLTALRLARLAHQRSAWLTASAARNERRAERMSKYPDAVALESRAASARRLMPIRKGQGLAAHDPWLESVA